MVRESGRGLNDSQVARFLTQWGQRPSRRGLLATVGKFALRLAGLSMLPLLPVDRSFAAVGDCAADWRLCGMFGQFCQNCCNQTASLTSCPTCTQVGSSWASCCCNTVNCITSCFMISYTDCCGTASGFTDSQAAACQDPTGCHRNPVPQPVWCGGVSGAYRCTVISVGAPC
jgi:hypothetical protein